MYSIEVIQTLGKLLHLESEHFQPTTFYRAFESKEWEEAALTQRVTFIVRQLKQHLPPSFNESTAVLLRIHRHFKPGFVPIFFPEFVSTYGMDHWKISMKALEEFTQTSSAEFAIRPFLLRYPQETLEQLKKWTSHKNPHVRRLASEGARPRLPWGKSLTAFIKDPSPVLPLLEALKQDEALYVRKSVANHLNDISKDHPQLALSIAQSWKNSHVHTDWIVKHAMRTLLKKGSKEALHLFGWGKTEATDIAFTASSTNIAIGQSTHFNCSFRLPKKEEHLRLEYVVYHQKANGTASPKVFMLREKMFEQGTHTISKKHDFSQRSTRQLYPGKHEIALLINGEEAARLQLNLTE